MLHIYPMCGIFYLPSIDTGTRGRQFNVSSERHPAGILLMKILGKFFVLRPGIEPGTSRAADKCLDHQTTQLPIIVSLTSHSSNQYWRPCFYPCRRFVVLCVLILLYVTQFIFYLCRFINCSCLFVRSLCLITPSSVFFLLQSVSLQSQSPYYHYLLIIIIISMKNIQG